jgi:ubiquitin related modifier 1
MELLFNNKRLIEIELPEEVKTVGDLLPFMRDHLLSSKPELFMSGNTV